MGQNGRVPRRTRDRMCTLPCTPTQRRKEGGSHPAYLLAATPVSTTLTHVPALCTHSARRARAGAKEPAQRRTKGGPHPAYLLAATPVSTMMPAPMMQPMPSSTCRTAQYKLSQSGSTSCPSQAAPHVLRVWLSAQHHQAVGTTVHSRQCWLSLLHVRAGTWTLCMEELLSLLV